jgi:hypothetical protein
MKTIKIILTVSLSISILILKAQDEKFQLNKGIGIGYQINQYQNDFGVGLNITSPLFWHNRMAIRLKSNLMYNENVKNAITSWTPYSNVSLGLIGIGGMVSDKIRLYGEGGFLGIFPSSEFSSKDFEFGGYGAFGFEFFMSKFMNYFIEIGGVGSGAFADKIVNKPIYSNGLTVSAGLRTFLK